MDDMPINQCVKCGKKAFPVWMCHGMPYCTEDYKEIKRKNGDIIVDPFLEALRDL